MQALSSAVRMGAASMIPMGLPPDSFHPLNGGVDFHEAYRLGMRGTFEAFTPIPPRQKLSWRFKRWQAQMWNLIKRACRQHPQYFVMW